jgi:hypothetical protein
MDAGARAELPEDMLVTGRGRSIAVVAIGMMLAPASVRGAQYVLPTSVFVVKNPTPSSARRMVLFDEEDPHGSATIVGDPTVSGATLHVALGNGGDQCFELPASGWVRVSRSGSFRYRGTSGSGPAVTASIEKEEVGGDFVLKWKLTGTRGPIDIVPQPGSASFAINFALPNGDEYCAGGSTPPGSASTDKVYRVKGVAAPGGCAVTTCP